MKHIAIWLTLIITTSAAYASNSDDVVLTSRGLIKKLYTLPHPHDTTRFSTWVALKGTSERATCTDNFISDIDNHSIEILRLAILLNKPVSMQYTISQDRNSTTHCEIHSVELKP